MGFLLSGKYEFYYSEEEQRGITKPWNLTIDKYSDFDLPLDLEEVQEVYEVEFHVLYREMLKIEKE